MSRCAMEDSPCVEALKVAAENGFDAFEVDIYFPTVDLDNWNWNEIEAIKEISRDAGIEICVTAAYYELNQPIQCRVIAAVRDFSWIGEYPQFFIIHLTPLPNKPRRLLAASALLLPRRGSEISRFSRSVPSNQKL